MRTTPVFLPEFHDIGEANALVVAEFLHEVAKRHGPAFTLLVIPEPIGTVLPKLCQQWLQSGHLLGLHGYRHVADSTLHRSRQGKLALRITNNEAEFAGLGSADSQFLLGEALHSWDSLQLGKPYIFVPPTWHDNPYLRKQCRAAGIAFYDRHLCRYDLRTNQRHLTPAFSFAGVPNWSLGPIAQAARLYGLLANVFPLPAARLVLHPCDLSPDRIAATWQLLEQLQLVSANRSASPPQESPRAAP